MSTTAELEKSVVECFKLTYSPCVDILIFNKNYIMCKGASCSCARRIGNPVEIRSSTHYCKLDKIFMNATESSGRRKESRMRASQETCLYAEKQLSWE